MSDQGKYTVVASILHWIVFILVCALFGLGWFMTDLPPGPDRGFYFATHKSIGISLFVVMILRLGWRLFNRPPALRVDIPTWKALLAKNVHLAFYILLFLQPITGYLSSSFSGYDTSLFGYPLPSWGWKHESLNDLFSNAHTICSSAILVCVALHILGVISHVRQEGILFLNRIKPW